MTDTFNDERIQAYMGDCKRPLEGYGFFLRVLEIVAKQMDTSDKCEATYPLKTWSRFTYLHHHAVEQFLMKLEGNGLVTTTKDNNRLTVKIPNLLKYRDEYSRKRRSISGQNQEQETDTETDTETEAETEAETDTNTSNVQAKTSEHFPTFWNSYPKKTDKKKCEKFWITNNLDKLADQIISHVEARKKGEWADTDKKFIPGPYKFLFGERYNDELIEPREAKGWELTDDQIARPPE